MQRGAVAAVFGLATAAALVQTGCISLSQYVHNGFKVGPNYEPPLTPVPDRWVDASDPKVQEGDPNLASWWDVFEDPILTRLLHDCYANNLTVRAAGLQIMQAEIARFIARSELLPQAQNYALGYTRGLVSNTKGTAVGPGSSFGTGLSPGTVLAPVSVPATPITGATPTGNGSTNSASNYGVAGVAGPGGGGVPIGRYTNNVGMTLNASWELDFWGLFRRNLEAANASLDQSVRNYDQMLVLLLANVANQYIEIRTLQRRLELARGNVALQEPLVAQQEKLFNVGMANAPAGYYQLLSNLENTKALIPTLEIALREANNQLCVLIGQPVHDMLPELGDGTVPDPTNPEQRYVRIPHPRDESVVVGIPAQFLLRRPDVKAAEDQLRVQSAAIGISEAELLPHLGINGSIGIASGSLGNLFQARSGTGNIGPSLTWNIFNYGRLLANIRFQNLLYRQFVATYQQAVLNANQDAENSMIAYLRTLDQAEHLHLSADAAVKYVDYLLRQFRIGYLGPAAADTGALNNLLFVGINFRVQQQDAAAQAEGNIALNLVLLYRAMGGGWQIRLEGEQEGPQVANEDGLRILPPDVPAAIGPPAPAENPPANSDLPAALPSP
jgi:NodT family efflux transporter outer membrane factor (OMF) lipoprotein